MTRAISRLFVFFIVTIFAANMSYALGAAEYGRSLPIMILRGASNLFGSSSDALTRSASILRQESRSAYDIASHWATVARHARINYATLLREGTHLYGLSSTAITRSASALRQDSKASYRAILKSISQLGNLFTDTDSIWSGASKLYESTWAALTRSRLAFRRESKGTYEAVSKTISHYIYVTKRFYATYMYPPAYLAE